MSRQVNFNIPILNSDNSIYTKYEVNMEEYQIKEYHEDLKKVFIHILCLEYVFIGRRSVTDSELFVECIRKKRSVIR